MCAEPIESDNRPSTVAPLVGAARAVLDPLGSGELGQIVGAFAADVRSAGGRALVVGGAVRDAVMRSQAGAQADVNDIDVEVFGLRAEVVSELLGRHGVVDTFGEAFAVYKLRGHNLDVALPRTERKHGAGHRGFLVNADPSITPEIAALRRDFTMNAISWDPLNGEVVDPVGGVADIEARRLRHVGPAFAEDPLRVLRAAQFIARFALRASADTIELCRRLLPEAPLVARERVAGEWSKLLLQGITPGDGLRFLRDCDWLSLLPPLDALRGVEQDPEWHPEGDVFVHTAHVLDAWARVRPDDAEDALVTGLAALCHDLGKASTTEFVDGRWRARGHEAAGVEPTRQLLGLISIRSDLAGAVVPLVEHHLKPSQLFAAKSGAPAVRRLANKVGGRLDRLVTVAHADQAGRPPLVVDQFEAGAWLLATAAELDIRPGEARIPPMISGRDLIALGLTPGPTVGRILAVVYEAQIDGRLGNHADGMRLAADLIGEHLESAADPVSEPTSSRVEAYGE